MTANASPAVLCELCAPAGKCMKRMALCVANGTAPATPAVLAPVDVGKVQRFTVHITPNAKTGRYDYEGCIPHQIGEYVRYHDHRAAVERLAADLAAAKREREWFAEKVAEMQRALGGERQRAEAAEADAARWKFAGPLLFAPDYGDNDEGRPGWVICSAFRKRGSEPSFFGESLDAAIDAALQEPRT